MCPTQVKLRGDTGTMPSMQFVSQASSLASEGPSLFRSESFSHLSKIQVLSRF